MEYINSVYDYFKERFKNPFFGALIIAWLARNWELVYSVFQFEDNLSRIERIEIIKSYVAADCFYENLIWIPLVCSLGAIAFLSLSSLVSLGIIEFFTKWGKPFVVNLIVRGDKNKIATRDEYNNLKNAYEGTKSENNKLETENIKLRNKNTEITKDLLDINDNYKKIKDEKDSLERKVKLKSDIVAFGNLFKEIWINQYEFEDGSHGAEKVEIKNNNEYYADGKLTFTIDMIEVDEGNRTLKFRKVGIGKDNRTAINELRMSSEDMYQGTENNTTKITYHRPAQKRINIIIEQNKQAAAEMSRKSQDDLIGDKQLGFNINIYDKNKAMESVFNKFKYQKLSLYWRENKTKTDFITLIISNGNKTSYEILLKEFDKYKITYIDAKMS